MTVDELEELSASVETAADPAAVELLRDAVDKVVQGEATAGRFAAVRGVACLVAWRLSGHDSDLDRAVQWLSAAARTEPTQTRAANLALALLDRGERDNSAADFDRAITLLRLVTDDPTVLEPYRRHWAVALLHAYIAVVQYDIGDNIDELLDHGESVVARYPGTDEGGVEGLLGGAHLLATQRGHERADLNRMIELLEMSLAALPAAHPDVRGRAATLGGALLDRYQALGHRADLERGRALLADSLGEHDETDSLGPMVLNNVLNAVLAEYERAGDPTSLAWFLPRATILTTAYPPHHPMYPIVMSTVGLLFRHAAHALDRPELIDDAVAQHEAAVTALEQDSRARPAMQLKLAIALGDRFARDGHPADLDRAVGLATENLDRIPGSNAELAGFAGNLGNFRYQRYLRDGRMSDLRTAAGLHARGLAVLPADHQDRAKVLNNAGIVRLELHRRLADPDEIARAADCFSEAVTTAETGGQDINLDAYLANLALARHRQAAVRHTDQRLAEATELALRARESTRDRTIRSAMDGLLAQIQRDRYARSSDPDDLAAFVEFDARTEPRDATDHLRRAIRLGLTGDHDGQRRHLLTTVDIGIDNRPEAAITATRLLADLGIRLFLDSGGDGLDLVEHAAAAAGRARERLVSTGEGRAADLSWHRDLGGLGALLAHARWLRGDLAGALDAFDATGAVLLSPYFPADTRIGQSYLALWCTEAGGAGVLARLDGTFVPVALPELTSSLATRLARRLAAAATIGPASLDAVLALAGTRISRTITGPLAAVLARGEPVVCAAGGPLGLLPIGMGLVDGTPFVARNPVTFALHRRSASWAARQAVGPVDTDDVVSVACPTSATLPAVPAARRESAAFAPLSARRRHGAAATPDALLAALSTASLVHVATHAATETNDPLAQHLLLADDAPLFVDAVLDAAPLSARLAVLSGCATGRTTVAHADEGLALASAVHAAGVPGVVSSLWSVLDPPTARFMGQVAEHLRDGRPPAEALRSAQTRAIAANSRTANWAAFVLLGQ